MKDLFKKILERGGWQFRRPPKKYTEDELLEFERKHGITLPLDYRNYLIHAGVGFNCDPCNICLLEEWCYPNDEFPADFLSRDFPHTKAWDDKSLAKEGMGWGSPYHDKSLVCGALRIVETGCEGYDLLIVSGPERGNIWHDDRICSGKGIYPLRTRRKSRVTFADYVRIRKCERTFPSFLCPQGGIICNLGRKK